MMCVCVPVCIIYKMSVCCNIKMSFWFFLTEGEMMGCVFVLLILLRVLLI